MQQKNTSISLLLFLTFVAIIGLALVPLLVQQPMLQQVSSPLRIPLISMIYGLICIGGIVAVFYPNKCRMAFQEPDVSGDSNKKSPSTMELIGHHPNCERFSKNRITLKGLDFCAACTGLLLGAIGAIIGIFLFSFGFFAEFGNLWVLVIGEAFMVLGLFQIRTIGYVKVAVNSLFVLGSFISLVAVELIGKSWLVDAYFLVLIIFMLWFRILHSEWNNKRVCRECGRCV